MDMFFMRIMTLGSYLLLEVIRFGQAGQQEVCNGKSFKAECPGGESILVNSARYGRMRLGDCVPVDLGYIGCQNDVLHILDAACSGRRECTVNVPNDELQAAKIGCVQGLEAYLEVDSSCVEVYEPQGSCSSQTSITASNNGGYLSSHVTRQSGCGSSTSPWVIQVHPGQTVQLQLLDFGALKRQQNTLHMGCPEIHGFVVERSLGVNMTICGTDERERLLYSSKTNNVEIHIKPPTASSPGFLIHYTSVGCSDLTPPAGAWYKREGSEAVIGCKSNDRVWRLNCHGNTWDGVVGNCSSKENTQSRKDLDFSFSSVIFLTGVVCAAFLLVIVVVVAGSVYIKKQSIKHDIKLRSDYATLPRTDYTTARKPGYDTATLGTATIPVQAVNQRTWDASLLPSVTTRGSDPLGHVVPQSGGSNSRDLLQ